MRFHPARWCHLIAIAIASLQALSARAAVDVKFTVDTRFEGAAGAQNVPPDRHETINATLGDTWMVVRQGARMTSYDFSARRRTEIDETAHTRVESPLYDVVGFRAKEFLNRQNLSKMMVAAKISQVQFDAVETEHVLSIQEKPADPLRVTVQGPETMFANGDKVLARESLAATAVPPAQARMFAQLVRYTWGGHPQVLAAMTQSGSIPRSLTLTLPQGAVGVTTVALAVDTVRPSDVKPPDWSGYVLLPVDASQTPAQQVLSRGAAFTQQEFAAARRDARDRIEACFNEHRPFDAYLGIIEWSLTTGEAPPALDDARKEMLKTDPSVSALTAALAPHAKADLQKAIDQLEALRPNARDQGHMLDLFIANDRAMMGDARAALNGLIAVLQAHPFIAGAYKDLGDNLFMAFDTPGAWRSWDIGRRIAPGFANFRPIADFERNLAAQHPEYF